MDVHATTPLDRMVRESRAALAPLAGTGVAINVLMLASPLYSMQVFDRVQHSGSFETLALLTAALVACLGFVALLEMARDRMTSRVGEWIEETQWFRVELERSHRQCVASSNRRPSTSTCS